MWRSCRDAIPVKKNLMWRKILSEDNCEQCKQPSKNFLHALWECSELSGLWNSNPTFLFRLTQSFSSLWLSFLCSWERKKIWNCWQWSCGQYGIGEIISKLVVRIIHSHRWSLQLRRFSQIFSKLSPPLLSSTPVAPQVYRDCNTPKKKKKKEEGILSKFFYGVNFINNITKRSL